MNPQSVKQSIEGVTQATATAGVDGARANDGEAFRRALAESQAGPDAGPLQKIEAVELHAADTSRLLREVRSEAMSISKESWRDQFMSHVNGVEQEAAEISQLIDEFRSGKSFTHQELLAIQIRTQEFGRNVELMSKSLEHLVRGIKEPFNAQV